MFSRLELKETSTSDVHKSIEDILDVFGYTQCPITGSRLAEQRKATISRIFKRYIIGTNALRTVLNNGIRVSLQELRVATPHLIEQLPLHVQEDQYQTNRFHLLRINIVELNSVLYEHKLNAQCTVSIPALYSDRNTLTCMPLTLLHMKP